MEHYDELKSSKQLNFLFWVYTLQTNNLSGVCGISQEVQKQIIMDSILFLKDNLNQEFSKTLNVFTTIRSMNVPMTEELESINSFIMEESHIDIWKRIPFTKKLKVMTRIASNPNMKRISRLSNFLLPNFIETSLGQNFLLKVKAINVISRVIDLIDNPILKRSVITGVSKLLQEIRNEAEEYQINSIINMSSALNKLINSSLLNEALLAYKELEEIISMTIKHQPENVTANFLVKFLSLVTELPKYHLVEILSAQNLKLYLNFINESLSGPSQNLKLFENYTQLFYLINTFNIQDSEEAEQLAVLGINCLDRYHLSKHTKFLNYVHNKESLKLRLVNKLDEIQRNSVLEKSADTGLFKLLKDVDRMLKYTRGIYNKEYVDSLVESYIKRFEKEAPENIPVNVIERTNFDLIQSEHLSTDRKSDLINVMIGKLKSKQNLGVFELLNYGILFKKYTRIDELLPSIQEALEGGSFWKLYLKRFEFTYLSISNNRFKDTDSLIMNLNFIKAYVIQCSINNGLPVSHTKETKYYLDLIPVNTTEIKGEEADTLINRLIKVSTSRLIYNEREIFDKKTARIIYETIDLIHNLSKPTQDIHYNNFLRKIHSFLDAEIKSKFLYDIVVHIFSSKLELSEGLNQEKLKNFNSFIIEDPLSYKNLKMLEFIMTTYQDENKAVEKIVGKLVRDESRIQEIKNSNNLPQTIIFTRLLSKANEIYPDLEVNDLINELLDKTLDDYINDKIDFKSTNAFNMLLDLGNLKEINSKQEKYISAFESALKNLRYNAVASSLVNYENFNKFNRYDFQYKSIYQLVEKMYLDNKSSTLNCFVNTLIVFTQVKHFSRNLINKIIEEYENYAEKFSKLNHLLVIKFFSRIYVTKADVLKEAIKQYSMRIEGSQPDLQALYGMLYKLDLLDSNLDLFQNMKIRLPSKKLLADSNYYKIPELLWFALAFIEKNQDRPELVEKVMNLILAEGGFQDKNQ